MADQNHEDDTPSPPSGLKAQLNHLLPRRALFRVRVHIHQLASVPLVHGEFGVRWKFKNTHKIREKSRARSEHEGDGDSEEAQTLPASSSRGPSRSGSSSSVDESRSPINSQFASTSNVLDEEDLRESRSRRPGMRSRTDSSYTPPQTPSAQYSSPSFLQEDPFAPTSARGQTPWVPLRDHSVTWEHPLSVVVQMSIDRGTQQLLSHPFKLTILQRVVQGDPNSPRNPRFGAVILDLAEYADSMPAAGPSKGVVNRRYLLRDSKTNAILKLSIRVEPAGSPPPFVAPPLPQGEILAGVGALLSSDREVFRTRPRALDLYPPPAAEDENDSPPRKPTFDVRALPRAYGPRPTESLIEAIFNPVPVRDPGLVGPFTRLVPEGSPYLSASYSSSFTASLRSGSSASSSASLRSVEGSLGPSTGAPSALSNATSLSPDDRPSHWWQRSRSRSRSRSRTRTPVAVA